MRYYAIADESGAIVQTGACETPSFIATKDNTPSDQVFLETDQAVSADTHYIAEGEVLERQEMPIHSLLYIVADGEDEAVITDVPIGAVVVWPDGETEVATSEEVRFSVDLPGEYVLLFSAVAFLDKEVIVEARSAD